MSYAGLVYSGTPPIRSARSSTATSEERLTAASRDLLFFGLELNRIDDAVLDRAMAAELLAHYRPWLEDLRKDKPYQLDDKIEKLFHEKSVTGRAAWNRLFDETIASLRFDVRGEELPIEPTLNKMQDPDETVRKDASDALAKTLKENHRGFTLITNAGQGQGTLRIAGAVSRMWRIRHLANRVEREVVEALVAAVREAYPRLSHRYYALKARWFGKDGSITGIATTPAEGRPAHHPLGRGEGNGPFGLFGFSPHMADIARRFFDERWIDAPT